MAEDHLLPIVVGGLGRCGTTMVMNMLHAGGIDCIGDPPAFEDRRAARYLSGDQLRAMAPGGQAVKVLDTHLNLDHRAACQMILCRRNVRQQAASHAKFTRIMLGADYNREQRRRLEDSLTRDWTACTRTFLMRQPLVLAFEEVLADPLAAALRIATHLGRSIDGARAAAVVRSRGPNCRPDLSIELDLVAQADALPR